MLPLERPGVLMNVLMNQGKSSNTQHITERDRDSDMQYICRNYHMAYIPSGFWSRLIGEPFYVYLALTFLNFFYVSALPPLDLPGDKYWFPAMIKFPRHKLGYSPSWLCMFSSFYRISCFKDISQKLFHRHILVGALSKGGKIYHPSVIGLIVNAFYFSPPICCVHFLYTLYSVSMKFN